MIDNFISNLQDGIYHVLHFSAYEHILFFTALVLPYAFKHWKRILLLITIFSIGHCTTLALTLYNFINVDNNIISLLALLCISVVALYNIFTAGKKALHSKTGLIIIIILFFGLVHGLGFSNEFKALATASENTFLNIIEIALGMGIGIVVIAFILIFLSFLCQTIFRFSKRDWVMVISSIVLGCLIPMLIQHKLLS
ncbi:HupE/UreJ family protein [Psychroserpens sp.]|uniref:HupE/UreJ family protein n=1 Tax=Psychroserpens sp. TaxID=2020870 RepID=UPI00385C0F7E